MSLCSAYLCENCIVCDTPLGTQAPHQEFFWGATESSQNKIYFLQSISPNSP